MIYFSFFLTSKEQRIKLQVLVAKLQISEYLLGNIHIQTRLDCLRLPAAHKRKT